MFTSSCHSVTLRHHCYLHGRRNATLTRTHKYIHHFPKHSARTSRPMKTHLLAIAAPFIRLSYRGVEWSGSSRVGILMLCLSAVLIDARWRCSPPACIDKETD